MIASVAPGTGSIVSVAGPAMMIDLMGSPVGLIWGSRIAAGCRSAAERTGALIGVGVGLGVGIGVEVAVAVGVGVAVGVAVGVGDAGVAVAVGVGVGLGGGRPASMTPRD